MSDSLTENQINNDSPSSSRVENSGSVVGAAPAYASFWMRLGAHLIDFVLTNAIELAVEYAIAGIVFVFRKFLLKDGVDFDHAMNPMVEQGMSIIFGLGLAYYYYVVFQLKQGTTIGKKVFSIYVVDYHTGAPITKKQAIIRLLGYLPSYIIVGCGFLMAAFHPEKRALHDLIAGTACVRRPKKSQ